MNPPVLNENFRWSDESSFRSAGFGPHRMHEARGAFIGAPAHIRLKSGECLYRFQSHRTLAHHGRISPWWLPADSVDEIRYLHRTTGLSFEEVVRSLACLAFDFQERCNFELRARLLVPVDVFMGPFSSQGLLAHPYSAVSQKKNWNPGLAQVSTRGGYLNQLFVPNLRLSDVSVRHWETNGPSGGFSLIT